MKNNVQAKQVHVQNKEQTMVILGKVSELTLGGGAGGVENNHRPFGCSQR